MPHNQHLRIAVGFMGKPVFSFKAWFLSKIYCFVAKSQQ